MNKKQHITLLKQAPYKGILPKVNSSVSLLLTGLVLCSVSVVTKATQSDPEALNTPTYSLQILSHEEGENRTDSYNQITHQDKQSTNLPLETDTSDEYQEIKAETPDVVQVQGLETSNRTIRLHDGGVIWITKDPSKVSPKLNVTANSNVEIENNLFANPISFSISTNYAHYIDAWELEVYHSNDKQFKKPFIRFAGKDLSKDIIVKWDGKTENYPAIKVGDKLLYRLSAKSKQGHLDQTNIRYINIVGPSKNINQNTSVSSYSNTLESNLKIQTIPVNGSTVRISGRDIPNGNKLTINNKSMNFSDGKFVTETILPQGKHTFAVDVTGNDNEIYSKSLDIDLKGEYFFAVGLADITVGEGKVSGNLESLSDGDEHLDGDIFIDGRLAFYLKGKIKGKYLVTAQADTETGPIDELFEDLHKKDPQSIFRRLDPDKYYPVYGDDSTIIDDTDSQGKLYARVDWDKSSALWGNFNTSFTGTELSSFNRSLYGAKVKLTNTKVTSEGEHKTDLTVFASEAQSAFGHNQFLGTGGSLFYLKDTDIVDGSEKIWIEVRADGDSERAINKVVLVEGRDYQIDDFQGRIILNRPLLQIAQQSNPSLIKDEPLDGNQVYLMVDYEYVPDGFESDKASYGARGKVWLSEHVAVGGTVVHEDRNNNDYDHKGVDLTIKKAEGTYLKGEYAKSESNQSLGSFYSTDGGINFAPFSNNVSNVGSDRKGSAYSVEARLNLDDFSSKEGSVGAWYRKREAGFSNSNFDNIVDTVDSGLEALVSVTDNFNASLRAQLLDKKSTSKKTSVSVQGDYHIDNKNTVVSAEVRRVKEKDFVNNANDGEGTLGAIKVGIDLTKHINLYGIAQNTFSKSGNYESNDLITVGTIARVNDSLDLNAEISTGDRGNSSLVGLRYKVSDDYDLYTNYTLSTDRVDNQRNIFTVGQRKTVTNQLKVYSEHQYTQEDKQAGLGHTFGLDYDLTKDLTANLSYQRARLENNNNEAVDRDAFSVGLNYQNDQTEASTRLEYRKDQNTTENTRQWVTTNRVNHRLSSSLRIQGKLNYSETNSQTNNTLDAKFAEAGIGFAYRPINHDRHNILGRLTYLYDLQPLSQGTNPDEKSLIASIENTYQVNKTWEIGGKLAHKQGQIRDNRATGDWEKNDATLVAIRARYHLNKNWDAMAQYHWMNSEESQDTQHGAMISVDRHIGKNMKIGIGYNFSNFDDDLSKTQGDAKGWFINLVGKF